MDRNLPRLPEVADGQPDEQQGGRPGYEVDPSLPRAAGPLSPLLPGAGLLSPVQIRFRSRLQDTVQVLMSPCGAPGAIRTFGGAPKSRVPKIADRIDSPVLPLATGDTFVAISGAVSLPSSKSAPPVTAQPLSWLNYVEPVTAAAPSRRVARGPRAISAQGRSPQMGACWYGRKRACVHAWGEKPSLLLKQLLEVCEKGAGSLSQLSAAVDSGSLPLPGVGPGVHMAGAMAVRPAAPMAVTFFGIRRSSGMRRLSESDVKVDFYADVVDLKAGCQKNDQYGTGQLSHLREAPP